MIPVLISHARFAEGRVESCARLMDGLWAAGLRHVEVLASEQREPGHVWARRAWQRAADIGGAVLVLQDDVRVHPRLGDVLLCALAAADASIVALHTTFPAVESLAWAGARWVRSTLVSGPAYVLRHGVARRILGFCDKLDRGLLEKANDDHLLQYFAAWSHEPAWSTVPALVVHDASVPSTFGYDGHPWRTTPVSWEHEAFRGVELARLDTWRAEREPAFLGCSWMSESELAGVARSVELGFGTASCWACGRAPGAIRTETGAMFCRGCLVTMVGALLGVVPASRA